ncbi:MAG: hypothetical protein HY393_03120 [Candidatus Diapherotrites archaeon]|nr:hypothetical protein [Candidatus Diapherotrites archaeon]
MPRGPPSIRYASPKMRLRMAAQQAQHLKSTRRFSSPGSVWVLQKARERMPSTYGVVRRAYRLMGGSHSSDRLKAYQLLRDYATLHVAERIRFLRSKGVQTKASPEQLFARARKRALQFIQDMSFSQKVYANLATSLNDAIASSIKPRTKMKAVPYRRLERGKSPFTQGESDSIAIKELLQRLPFRRREIVRKYFGIDGPKITFKEIGREFGLSSPRIQQIFNRSIVMLRKTPVKRTPLEEHPYGSKRKRAVSFVLSEMEKRELKTITRADVKTMIRPFYPHAPQKYLTGYANAILKHLVHHLRRLSIKDYDWNPEMTVYEVRN